MSPGAFKRRVDNDGTINRPGRPTALPVVVEDKIAEKVLDLADCGHALTPKQLQLYARGVAAKLKVEIGTWSAGKAWLQGFMRRHPEISRRTPTKTTGARLATFNRLNVAKWYSVTRGIAKQYGAKYTFNVDDTGFNVEEGKQKVGAADTSARAVF